MSKIDLSTLPAPQSLATLSYAETRNAWIDALSDEDLIASLVPGDPIYEAIQFSAYRELYKRAEIKEQLKQAFIATAWGAGLDLIGDPLGAPRNAGEADDIYRARIHENAREVGTGTYARYKARALSAATAAVHSVHVWKASKADVRVAWSAVTGASTGDKIAAGLAMQLELDSQADPEGIDSRMITDQITVQEAGLASSLNLAAHLYLRNGPDPEAALDAANAAAADLVKKAWRPGYQLYQSEIYSNLMVNGVGRVDVTSPTGDLTPLDNQYYVLTPVITYEILP